MTGVDWNNQISRINADKVAKTARNCSPTGRLSVERPQTGWNDNILDAD